VHLETTIAEIDAAAGAIVDREGRRRAYDRLVVATGATAQRPDLPGIDARGVFTLKDLGDALRLQEALAQPNVRRVILLGAGFIALEMAEAFRERGLATTILYRGALPMRRLGAPLAQLLLDELERHQVVFAGEQSLRGIEAGAAALSVVTDRGQHEADLVLAALGVAPNVALARQAGLRIGESGALWTDATQRTSRSEIYAAGDCTEVTHLVSGRPIHLPLGDVANKQGRVAGVNIGGGRAEFPGVLGSQCFKLFDLEVAYTGLTAEQARVAGLEPITALVRGRTRAGAYPGAKPIHLQLVAEAGSGRLLGAQIVGGEGAVGRANTVAAALHRRMTLADLALLDLCYAPPYAPAWDPLHIAAQECLKQV
jgi:NADPH-dependent 2,4-dienoyl-CoA reductase/sulfur reductase-like enzyme